MLAVVTAPGGHRGLQPSLERFQFYVRIDLNGVILKYRYYFLKINRRTDYEGLGVKSGV